MNDRRHVTDAISVSRHSDSDTDTIHLSYHAHFAEGEFLTSALLLSRAQAKDLAAALTAIAEATV